MTRMVRKQIYITKGQDETLKRVAAERGQTEAEVVRTCLEALTSEAEAQEAKRLEAGRAFIEFARRRAEQFKDVPQEPRDWTRDELYEERLDKIMHRP
jgi:hypothetical protein